MMHTLPLRLAEFFSTDRLFEFGTDERGRSVGHPIHYNGSALTTDRTHEGSYRAVATAHLDITRPNALKENDNKRRLAVVSALTICASGKDVRAAQWLSERFAEIRIDTNKDRAWAMSHAGHGYSLDYYASYPDGLVVLTVTEETNSDAA